MRHPFNEVAELETMVGIHQDFRDCPMCSFNEPEIANLKNLRDAAELRSSRFAKVADQERKRRERWRFWFYVAVIALGISILKGIN